VQIAALGIKQEEGDILNTMRLLTFLMIILVVLVPASTRCQGFLHASGTKIVNGYGNEFILKGMGLGGWLVPEGYMLETADFANSPSEIRKKIADLMGESNTDQFFRLYRSTFITRRDIDSIAHWGFNSVRLPMHYNLFTPRGQPGVYLTEGFEIVDSLLSWCESNRLYLILDLHCAPGGQNSGNISDYDPTYPSLWESQQNRTQTIDLWKKLAERYATREWIGGYDLLNETAWDLGTGNVPLRNLYIDITTAIRSVDTSHIIFIEGNWYATDFSGLTPPWDDNMAYSFHKYWNPTDQGSIGSYLSLRSTYDVPLWLGESGENSNQWFAEVIALTETNKIGWSWWTHKKIGGITGPLSAIETPDYDFLLRYWRGQATQPTIQYAVDALNGMAVALRIENCVLHRDVLDALFRQPYTDATVPWTDNMIPGIVYLTNYDIGKNQIAYSDVDYENTGNGSWNSGFQFRNDGVDIEACSDFPSNGYSIGWISSGEFVGFTARVAQAGTYAISLRAAANAAGGKVILKRDGQSIGSFVDIPNSGGWQSWQTVDLGLYPLTAGTHFVSLHLFFGGFNVNYLEFTLLSTNVSDKQDIPTSNELKQNYPNPFNLSTEIDYRVFDFGLVTLKVYDLLGRQVAVLVDERKAPGSYLARFDASGLTSGVYFYRLRVGDFTQTKRLVLLK
jgi:endoglucanase